MTATTTHNPAEAPPGGVVRGELLDWLAQQGGSVEVSSGTVRQLLIASVLPIVRQRWGLGTSESLSVTISQLVNQERVLRQVDRRRIELTDKGKRAAADWRRALNGSVSDEDDTAVATPTEDDNGAQEPTDEPEQDVTPEPEQDVTPEPEQDGDTVEVDYDALAQALLRRVIDRALAQAAPTEDPQKSLLVDRLKANQTNLDQAKAAIAQLRSDRQTLTRRLAESDSQIEQLKVELRKSRDAHGKANKEIGELRQRIESTNREVVAIHRTYGNVIKPEQREELHKLMKELPKS